jgi:hypothetical protein
MLPTGGCADWMELHAIGLVVPNAAPVDFAG